MNTNPTNEICSNYGHNFFRETKSDAQSDIIKCKHCSIQITMNGNGDYEEISKENLLLQKLMKKLFLIRIQRIIHIKQHIFNI